jgi:hypothetical protein
MLLCWPEYSAFAIENQRLHLYFSSTCDSSATFWWYQFSAASAMSLIGRTRDTSEQTKSRRAKLVCGRLRAVQSAPRGSTAGGWISQGPAAGVTRLDGSAPGMQLAGSGCGACRSARPGAGAVFLLGRIIAQVFERGKGGGVTCGTGFRAKLRARVAVHGPNITDRVPRGCKTRPLPS